MKFFLNEHSYFNVLYFRMTFMQPVWRLKKIFMKIIMLLQKGFHHFVEPLWAIALLCYTTTCIYFPYNLNSYKWWRQKSVSESFHRKWGIWFIARIKHTLSRLDFIYLPFQFESWSNWLSLQKRQHCRKDLRLAKSNCVNFFSKWTSTYCN